MTTDKEKALADLFASFPPKRVMTKHDPRSGIVSDEDTLHVVLKRSTLNTIRTLLEQETERPTPTDVERVKMLEEFDRDCSLTGNDIIVFNSGSQAQYWLWRNHKALRAILSQPAYDAGKFALVNKEDLLAVQNCLKATKECNCICNMEWIINSISRLERMISAAKGEQHDK